MRVALKQTKTLPESNGGTRTTEVSDALAATILIWISHRFVF